MSKFDPKAEISPAVAAIVILLVVVIAAGLVWYFMGRDAAPEMDQGPGMVPVPGAPPQMPGGPADGMGPAMPPPPPAPGG